jgi:cytochrome c-type biogenesis protein CcmF
VTYIDQRVEQSTQKTTIKARLHIDGVGDFSPAISTYPNFTGGIGTPSIHTNPLRDWYVTLVSSPTSGRITIAVQVGALVMWLWIGGLIMVLGTALALVPTRRRKQILLPETEAVTPALAEVTS